MAEDIVCPLCDLSAQRHSGMGGSHAIVCKTCGHYKLVGYADEILKHEPKSKRLILSAYSREAFLRGEPFTIIYNQIGDLLEEARKHAPKDDKRVDRLLLNLDLLRGQLETPDQRLMLNPDRDYPLSWASGPQEFDLHLGWAEQGVYITRITDWVVVFTLAGVRRLAELKAAVQSPVPQERQDAEPPASTIKEARTERNWAKISAIAAIVCAAVGIIAVVVAILIARTMR